MTNPTAAAIVAAIASYKVLFSNSHPAKINEAIAIIDPPGRRNAAGDTPSRRRRTGRAAQVTA